MRGSAAGSAVERTGQGDVPACDVHVADRLRIAYVLGTFPQASERFALREILEMRRQGCHVQVLALQAGAADADVGQEVAVVEVLYRPKLLSVTSLASLWRLLRRPASAGRLVWRLCSTAMRSPGYALRLLRNLHTVSLFADRVRQDRIDCIHGYFLSLPGLLAAAVSDCTNVPFTLAGHARDVFVEPAPLALLLSDARAAMACNTDAAEGLRQVAGGRYKHKVHLVHHGIDLGEWGAACQDRAKESHPAAILAAGRWVPKKGYAVLLRSGALLRDRGIAFRLVLAGDGPCREELAARVRDDGLAERVVLPGWLSQAALQTHLGQASMLVMPSIVAEDGDRDGIPNVVLEAAAAGVPIVASRLAGLSEFVRDERTGVLVPPGDPVALADAIERLLRSAALCRALGAEARALVEREYDLRRNVATIRRLLSAVRGAAHA